MLSRYTIMIFSTSGKCLETQHRWIRLTLSRYSQRPGRKDLQRRILSLPRERLGISRLAVLRLYYTQKSKRIKISNSLKESLFQRQICLSQGEILQTSLAPMPMQQIEPNLGGQALYIMLSRPSQSSPTREFANWKPKLSI